MRKNHLLRCLLGAATLFAVAIGAAAPEGNPSATGDYIRSNGSHMTINAVTHKDGRTTGWMLFDSGFGSTIVTQVDTLVIIGNKAWMHGIVVAATNTNLIGRHSYHHVTDNGEGRKSEPDLAAGFNNLVNSYPDMVAALQGGSPILAGNIQVRGR